MKNIYLLIFVFLLLGLNLNSQTVEEYYAPAQGKTGSELRNALHNIISTNIKLSYTPGVWDALKITDEDPNNSNNVILLYSGWSYPKDNNGGSNTEWNREHTWAKSMGDFGTDAGPGTDIHHLRPTDVTVNGARGNLYFDNGGNPFTDASVYGGGSGVTNCFYDGDSWEPRDAVKGDVARMMFYMDVRCEPGDMIDLVLAEYSSSTGNHGKLSTLLQWHKNDPVDGWELSRNEKIFNIQGNRNPFINHPEYVDLIWDGSGNNNGGDYTELFKEDFENETLGKMKGYNVIGETVWYAYNNQGDKFAKMSGYNGSSTSQNEDWLINTNAVDLSGYSDLTLSFISMMKLYGGNTSLTVHISSDYDGTSNPNGFTWTDVTSQATYSTGDYNRVPSGSIDLTSWANQLIYVAFKFENAAIGSSTWQLDDIKVIGKEITSSVNINALRNVYLYPNPAQNQITIVSDANVDIDEVRIFDVSGLVQKVISPYKNNSSIDLGDLRKGMYIIQMKDADGGFIVKKLVVK